MLIIGIVRAWELVGDRATGIIASIAVLTGHGHNPGAPLPASALPDPAGTEGQATPDRRPSPGQTTPGVNAAAARTASKTASMPAPSR